MVRRITFFVIANVEKSWTSDFHNRNMTDTCSGLNEFVLVNNKFIATESKQMVPDQTAPLGAV